MRIDVYEILTTNSLSGSRIIINDNFKMLADGLNSLYSNIDIDDDGKMSLSNVKSIDCETANIQNANIGQFSNGTKVCMKIDENGHLLLLDENGDLKLDVNQFIINGKGSDSGESEKEKQSRQLKDDVDANISVNPANGRVSYEYVDD